MTGTEIATIVAALASAPLWQIGADLLKVGRRDRKDELAQTRKERDECESKIADMEARLSAVENSRDSYFARWMTDATRKLIWMNDKAFLMLWAPLGFGSKNDIYGKSFAELLNDPFAALEIDALHRAALAHPGNTQSKLLQLHPSLPFLVFVKVATMGPGAGLQFEGCAYQPGDPEIRHAGSAGNQLEQVVRSAEHLLDAAPKG